MPGNREQNEETDLQPPTPTEGLDAGKEHEKDTILKGSGEEQLEGDEEVDGDEDDGPNDPSADDEWEELYACPLTVRFTQDKIHPFFYRRGPIVNVVPKIRAVLMRTEDGEGSDVVELVAPFNPIHCLRKGDELWALDNRRLYALQKAAMEQWPQQCRIRLLSRDRLPRHKFKTQYRKMNTTTEGRSVEVCAKYQTFDTWSWFDRAIELEWYVISQRLGTLLSVFEVAPVLGALLFRTGLTGFTSRVPLVIAFVLTFGVDFLRQKVPIVERRICEMHVRAVMDGEVKELSPCPARQQYVDEDGNVDWSKSSAPQLAAMMVLILMLLLPYVLGLASDKLRSSLLSCWLGVACVLLVQIGLALGRTGGWAYSQSSGLDSLTPRLSPKHREPDDQPEGLSPKHREPEPEDVHED